MLAELAEEHLLLEVVAQLLSSVADVRVEIGLGVEERPLGQQRPRRACSMPQASIVGVELCFSSAARLMPSFSFSCDELKRDDGIPLGASHDRLHLCEGLVEHVDARQTMRQSAGSRSRLDVVAVGLDRQPGSPCDRASLSSLISEPNVALSARSP